MDEIAVDAPIVGFRCWHLEPSRPVLQSMGMPCDWPARRPIEAACDPLGYWAPTRPPGWATHAAPTAKCRCGLYARTTLDGCMKEYPFYPAYRSAPSSGLMTMGAVLMWGAVLRGRRVIRSQYAQVLCLTERSDAWDRYCRTFFRGERYVPEETHARRHATIDAICHEYSIPLIPYAAVTRYAAEFGNLTEDARSTP